MRVMKDLIRELFSFGLGAALYSKDQIEKIIDELVQKGEVGAKEAEQMVENIIEKGESSKKEFDDLIKSRVSQILKELNVVSREEYEQLQKRVEELEKKLQ